MPATRRTFSQAEDVPLTDLRTHPENPRQGDVGALTASLKRFGMYQPVVVQRSTGTILAGNHRYIAAKQLGDETIPVVYLDVDDDTARAILVADNRLSDLASYDDAQLGDLLRSLAGNDLLDGTGYDGDDVDDLLTNLAAAEAGGYQPSEDSPGMRLPTEAITEPGDVWVLDGKHRIMCGDARDAEQVAALLDRATVQLAVSSPPYADRREYDEASGFTPIDPSEYVAWIEPAVANIAAHLAEDGSWLLNLKAGVTLDGLDTELYVLDLVLAHVREWGWHFATEFCWERHGVPKSVTQRLKNQFEPVYQFTRGRWKFRPEQVRHPSDHVPVPFGPGAGDTTWHAERGNGGALKRRKHGKRGGTSEHQGTPWQPGEYTQEGLAYPGNRLPSMARTHEATGHAAAFPVGLPEFFVLLMTDPGDAVYDPFLGSGSTVLAAHNRARVGFGMELSAIYVDVAVARWCRTYGGEALRESDGARFPAERFTDTEPQETAT